MAWIGIFFIIIVLVLVGLVIEDALSERTRKVRRRDFESAMQSINKIDAIVDRYYPTLDVVGQALCDEIRDVIRHHRKEVSS